MIGALWFLVRTSARNRLRRQLLRLRQPRYALAFGLGLVYFWFFFLRNAGGARDASAVTTTFVAGFLGVVVVGYLAWAWLFGTDRTALAFTRAEVALLFPAPVSRRVLILYKLANAQLGILFSVLVWSVLMNRGGGGAVSSLMRGTGLWVAMTTFSLHRLGIGLLRSGVEEHGLSGAKRSWMPFAVFASAVGAVAWTVWSHRVWLAGDLGLRAWVDTARGILDLPPAAYVLWPVRVAFAPIVERDPGPWLAALAQALLLLALHVWWVLGSDRAFEEAAAEASEQQAKWVEQMRARRAGGAVVRPASRRRTLPLAARGAPEVALVWKHALWLLRTHQLRGLVSLPVLAFIAVFGFLGRGDAIETIIATIAAVVILVLLLFGPMTTRNDLRSDLLHLPMLKTLPMRGDVIVRAQVVSGALTAALPQLLLLAAALLALILESGEKRVPAPLLAAAAVGGPPLLLALNIANFSLHNGVALLFPGWVRLGERGPAGIEATGQMMLITGATLLSLALLLLLPALVGAVAWFAFGPEPGTALVTALLGGGLMLAAEAWGLVRALGIAFDRVEPMQVAQ